ncbi:MAG: S41 family peptidase [Clostridia bacterium]|nr:S41 family peptidase [Clostridia bacterium]
MNRKVSIGAALAIMLLGVLVTFQITMISVDRQYSEKLAQITENQLDYQKLSTIDQTVRRNYIKEIDEEAIEEEIINGYFDGLGDKYSYYMNPDEYSEYQSAAASSLVGIGITAHYDIENDAIAVYNIIADSPASQSGLLIGDLIISVNGYSVSEHGYFTVSEMISGEEGTVCNLTVLRDGYEKSFDITRAKITKEFVTWRMITDTTAYISIREFSGNAVSQFISALNEITSQGAQSVIYDVRGNPGGELEIVRSILDALLPEGPIVRMYDPDGKETVLESDQRSFSLPSVTLINIATASAAELFSAALKDYGMTTLVGENTYGKGSAQTVITLPDHSGIVLSTNLYSPPKSDSIEGVGVKPDIEIKLGNEVYSSLTLPDPETDLQLKKAIEILNENN